MRKMNKVLSHTDRSHTERLLRINAWKELAKDIAPHSLPSMATMIRDATGGEVGEILPDFPGYVSLEELYEMLCGMVALQLAREVDVNNLIAHGYKPIGKLIAFVDTCEGKLIVFDLNAEQYHNMMTSFTPEDDSGEDEVPA